MLQTLQNGALFEYPRCGESVASILKHEEQDDVSHSKEEEGVHQVEEEEAVKKASLEA